MSQKDRPICEPSGREVPVIIPRVGVPSDAVTLMFIGASGPSGFLWSGSRCEHAEKNVIATIARNDDNDAFIEECID